MHTERTIRKAKEVSKYLAAATVQCKPTGPRSLASSSEIGPGIKDAFHRATIKGQKVARDNLLPHAVVGALAGAFVDVFQPQFFPRGNELGDFDIGIAVRTIDVQIGHDAGATKLRHYQPRVETT